MTDSRQTTEERAQRLLSVLSGYVSSGYGRLAVAFSGGVDSAVVAQAAVRACGSTAVAITAVSPSLATGELDMARQLAAEFGIRHEVIHTQEFEQAGYQRNAGDRCYYCKHELYSQIEQRAAELQIDVICNGANLDDLGDHRPGMQAAREHQVRSPLIEAKLTKQDVRELARLWNMTIWDKPATPCLSSRLAYGVEVTPERVKRIDAAERFLKQHLNLRELRVRMEAHDLARIEVPLDALPQIVQEDRRRPIIDRLQDLGFRYVTIDLEGFRSGSLNRALDIVELQTHRPGELSVTQFEDQS